MDDSNQCLRYLWIGTIYTLLLLVFLLAPFDFYIPFRVENNNVRWILGANGIEFPSAGIIHSLSGPRRLYADLVSGTGITLEMWVSVNNDQQKGPARIVSYSADYLSRNFTLGQESRNLVVRLRTTETNWNGTAPDLIVEDVFDSEKPQHIVVTYDFSEERIYVNGQLRLHAPIPGGNFSNWNPSYSLVLGNESTGNRPWCGKLFLVSIYNRPLSQQEVRKNYIAQMSFDSVTSPSENRIRDGLVVLYSFTRGKENWVLDQSRRYPPVNLQIPTELQVTDKLFLSSPYRDFFSSTEPQIAELIGNVIVFIPLGFLFHAALKGWYQTSLKVDIPIFVTGTLFVLAIESLQYFLETRMSSMTDVVNNIVGLVLGIVIDKSRLYFIKEKVFSMLDTVAL